MNQYNRERLNLDTEEALTAFGVAELALAIIGVIASIIGAMAEMIVLTIFGAACLFCFVIGAVVVGCMAFGAWRRTSAEEPGKTT